MLALVLLLIATAALISIIDPEAKQNKLEQITERNLTLAKEALLAHAIAINDRVTTAGPINPNKGVVARLPCPDNGGPNPPGEQEPGCGAGYAAALGKLPWITLGIDAPRDASNECLWYAVSGYNKTQPGTVPMIINEDSPGQFLLYASDGNTLVAPIPDVPDNRIVAAVFAPGTALAGQTRNPNPNIPCDGDYNAADYLESAGIASNKALSGLSYATERILQGDKNSDDVVNDRVITITKSELWNAVLNRRYVNPDPASPVLPATPTITFHEMLWQFTYELAQCVANYGLNDHAPVVNANDRRLPWAVRVNSVAGANWFYADDNYYADSVNTMGGRFPFTIAATELSAGYTSTGNSIFVEGRCTAFVDLTGPPYNLPQHPTYPLYSNLWTHWKDHMFYAVSSAFAPSTPEPALPPAAPVNCAGNCLTVGGGGAYAAIVIFSGSPVTPLQSRRAPPGPDDKQFTNNYLQPINTAAIDSANGTNNFNYSTGSISDDLLVCIKADMSIDSDCNPGTPL